MTHRTRAQTRLTVFAAAAVVCAAAYAADPPARPAGPQQEQRRRAPAAEAAPEAEPDVDLFGRKIKDRGSSPAGRSRVPPPRDVARQTAAPVAVGKPLERVGEIMRWLALEQFGDGSWSDTARLSLDAHVRGLPRPGRVGSEAYQGSIADTALIGLALARAGVRPGGGEHGRAVGRAAELLYRLVMNGGRPRLRFGKQLPPIVVRVGPDVQHSLALLFFLELRKPGDRGAVGDVRYDAAAVKLIEHIEVTQQPDGSWHVPREGAANAPLLGHALAVWALEAAVREGFEVGPKVIARAGQYAMTEAAERREWKVNGDWKTDPRHRLRGTDGAAPGDDPVNFEFYLMAARLSVLHQADLTNRWVIRREQQRLDAEGAGAPSQRLRDLARAAKTTRAALEAGRDVMRRTWTKLHKLDKHPGPGPVLFSGEDFLATLLTVDAMAERKDVEQWYPPVVQRIMHFHYIDGGVQTDGHLASPEFARPDRPWMTAATLMMLVADTPYRRVFLGLDRRRPPTSAEMGRRIWGR